MQKPKAKIVLWILGRTNVGKSTLFNRILWSFRAIVTDIPGTTREIIQEHTELLGQSVTLLDSPWLDAFEEEIPFLQRIIDESDILLFVGDGREGRSAQDDHIAGMINKSGRRKDTIMIVNKLDGKVYGRDHEMELAERREYGLQDIVAVSAQQHEGLDRLSDLLKRYLDKAYQHKIDTHERDGQHVRDHDDAPIDTEWPLPLVIVGRPNTGKSTLLNTLIGEQMSVVSPIAGTTLDYISAEFAFQGQRMRVYDTAGMRKKGKTVQLEKIAYDKTMSLIEYIKPVVIVLCDLSEGLTHRDKTLIGEIVDKGMPVLLACNKTDLFTPAERKQAMLHLQRNLPFSRIPVVPISAEFRIGLPPLLKKVIQVYQAATTRLQTATLNKMLQDARVRTPPRFPKNKICKWKYITQVDTNPPTFMLSVNNKDYANFSFLQWCENVIRKNASFEGVPLRIVCNSKKDDSPFIKT